MPVAFIFLLYLGVVWAGPKLMKRREPVDLKAVLIVYNFAMVCLSVYMFHEVCYSYSHQCVCACVCFVAATELGLIMLYNDMFHLTYKCFDVAVLGHVLAV